jgi:hypothetical protein
MADGAVEKSLSKSSDVIRECRRTLHTPRQPDEYRTPDPGMHTTAPPTPCSITLPDARRSLDDLPVVPPFDEMFPNASRYSFKGDVRCAAMQVDSVWL